MIALRPQDKHVWDPRPLPYETEAETKTNYCETETTRPRWSRDLNIPAFDGRRPLNNRRMRV